MGEPEFNDSDITNTLEALKDSGIKSIATWDKPVGQSPLWKKKGHKKGDIIFVDADVSVSIPASKKEISRDVKPVESPPVIILTSDEAGVTVEIRGKVEGKKEIAPKNTQAND